MSKGNQQVHFGWRAGRLLTGLTAAVLAVSVGAGPAVAGPVSLGAVVLAADSSQTPTRVASDVQKIKALEALGIPVDASLLARTDQSFVFAIYDNAAGGSSVKAEALRAYLDSTDSAADAAYDFIVTGVYAAIRNDESAKIASDEAKARRREAAVWAKMDPRETVVIEKDDREFIIVVWQRAKEGSFIQAAAREAFRENSTQDDWTEFLTKGVKDAAQKDLQKELDDADAAQQAKLRAEQLRRAKTALLNLLQLPVSDVVLDTPNREFALYVKDHVGGTEVKLAAQAAANAPGADLDKALTDFIFTGGSEAHRQDQAAADGKALENYRLQVSIILDGAQRDGYEPALVAAAQQALKENTLLSLQTFLLKGQAAALREDLPAPAGGMIVEFKGAQSNRCASVAGAVGHGAETDGSKVVLFDCKANVTQRLAVNDIGGGKFVLKSVNSKMCLSNNAKAVVQTKCVADTAGQQWRFERMASGLFQIRNVATSLMLSHQSGKTDNQTPLVLQPMGDENVTNEQWRVYDLSRATANLAQPAVIRLTQPSDGCLDPRATKAEQLTVMHLGGVCLVSPWKWKLTDKGNRAYELVGTDNLCMDLRGQGAKPGTVVQWWTCNGSAAQRWMFRTGKNGAVKIVSLVSGAVLSEEIPEPPGSTPPGWGDSAPADAY